MSFAHSRKHVVATQEKDQDGTLGKDGRRVVDADVDAAEVLGALLHRLLDVLFIADVALQRQRLHASRQC